jgi:molecular chaperone HscC
MIIGIDLGTTNSLVGVWRDGAVHLISNASGAVMTPSAVSLDASDNLLIGLAARERLLTHPDRTVAAWKRYMGTNRVFRLGKLDFRVEELSSLVLASLKKDAEAFLGETVHEAVITVPAYFNDIQRKATKAAGELAGLKVERLLNEPTAAALAYGLQEGQGDRKIMVLDLGGGTFDVSILEMFDGIMEVRATAGDNFLGGEDFVDVIVDRFIGAVRPQLRLPPRSETAPIHGALRRQAEVAKRALSEHAEHEIALVHGDDTIRWTITRDDFETASEPLVARVRAPIERALRDAKLHPDEITHFVLAGGATRMPLFRRLAARFFRRLPIAQIDPDEVVARGAAVQAGLKMRDAALDDIVMTDVAPFTLGIDTSAVVNGQVAATGLYLPIIERNTVIPTSRQKTVGTVQDNQRLMRVRIFQGEARLVADNIELGELKVAVSPAPAGKEAVDIRFTYDVSGLLEIEARTISNGQIARLVIESHAGALTPDEIAKRLASLAHLKVHPRDQVDIRAVLARAERLYEERLGNEREMIGRSIDHFRQILDRQDPREVATARAEFVDWLDTIDVTFFP